jgi:hypothetical protein
MTGKAESFSLFLNSTAGSAYLQSRPSPNDVTFLVDWDAVFALNNHKYTKCKLRYEFSGNPSFAATPLSPINQTGVLVEVGINSKSTSKTGGVVLGLIDLMSTNVTTSSISHPSVFSNNFIGSIPALSSTLTVSSTASPTAMLATTDTITYWDPNTSAFATRNILSVLGQYTYTLSAANGALAVVSYPMTVSNPRTTSYVYMRSSTMDFTEGVSVEVPKGLRTLQIMLAASTYGASSGQQLMTSTALPDWGIMLHFELYDPVPNDYTYSQ